jgi:hypothetical protein
MSLSDCLEQVPKELIAYLDGLSSLAMVVIDSRLVIKDCNSGFRKLFSLTQNPLGRSLGDFLLIRDATELTGRAVWKLQCNVQSGVTGVLTGNVIVLPEGMIVIAERLLQSDSRIFEQMTLISNESVKSERELLKRNRALTILQTELALKVAELEATMLRVKQLEGIIPICMYCKKIRAEGESWHQLEKYLSEHSEAHFSHGLCPECLDRELRNLNSEYNS